MVVAARTRSPGDLRRNEASRSAAAPGVLALTDVICVGALGVLVAVAETRLEADARRDLLHLLIAGLVGLVPVTSLRLRLLARTVQVAAHGQRLAGRGAVLSGAATALTGIVATLLVPAVFGLAVTDPVALLLVGLMVATVGLLGATRTSLDEGGSAWPRSLAHASTTLVIVALGATALTTGSGLRALAASGLLGSLFGLGAAASAALRRTRVGREVPLRLDREELALTGLAVVGTTLLLGLDLLLAPAALRSEDVGGYRVSAFVGRSGVLVGAVVLSAYLPRLLDRARPGWHDAANRARHSGAQLALVGALSSWSAWVLGGTPLLMQVPVTLVGARLLVVTAFGLTSRSARIIGAWVGIGFLLCASAFAHSPVSLALATAASFAVAVGVARPRLVDRPRAAIDLRETVGPWTQRVSVVLTGRVAPTTVDTLRALPHMLAATGREVELLAPAGTARSLRDSGIDVVELRGPIGRAELWRESARHATGDVLVLLDADGSVDPADLPGLVALRDRYRCDGVVASTAHPRVEWRRSRGRWGHGFRRLLDRTIARPGLGDGRVGLKIFRRELVQTLAADLSANGIVADLELLSRARRAGAIIIEAPVVFHANVRTRSPIVGEVSDLVRVAYRTRRAPVVARSGGEQS